MQNTHSAGEGKSFVAEGNNIKYTTGIDDVEFVLEDENN